MREAERALADIMFCEARAMDTAVMALQLCIREVLLVVIFVRQMSWFVCGCVVAVAQGKTNSKIAFTYVHVRRENSRAGFHEEQKSETKLQGDS